MRWQITAGLGAAILLLLWLWVSARSELAVQRQENADLTANHNAIKKKYQAQHQAIAARDRQLATLRDRLDASEQQLRRTANEDPSVNKWAAEPLPGPVREFLRRSRETAAAMSRQPASPDRSDAHPRD